MSIKIALAMIVKGADDEAVFLDRCLTNIAKRVDGIFVTITHKRGEVQNFRVREVCDKHKAKVSDFEWVNDFSAARNFNFSQVPKEFGYILWCDADDSFIWLSKTREALEDHPEIDGLLMQYYYDKDQNHNPTVIHWKTQVVKNDGCVRWVGRIHEDFAENRKLNIQKVDETKRIHLTTESHVDSARVRNLEIAKIEAKERPEDPKVFFNLGNSYLGVGKYKNASSVFKKYLDISGSDNEKYVIYQRLAHCEARLGNRSEAVDYLLRAIGLFPDLPDARNQLGYMCFDFGDLDKAEYYILGALLKKPEYNQLIVYNPRDYDYNPMMALAKVYFKKNRPDLALPMLKGCLKIYPDDPKLLGLVEEMDNETARLEKVIETVKHIETLGENKEKIIYAINKLPVDLQSHPAICRIRNKYEFKNSSSGKDIAYYCGETKFEWNPDLFKIKGFGGSEEAVINLSKEWAKQGFNVTVYNSCGIEPMVREGVTYKPWWMFNGRDVWDHLILWRHPGVAEFELGAKNIYVDLHDVVSEGEFTEKRLKRIKKIFVKTKAHRVLFPNIPDDKFAIIPNGQDNSLFTGKEERDPFLLINTSSPDRSMDVLPKLFKEVKKRVPGAKLQWAYGWNNFDQWYAGDKRMMEWKDKVIKEMEEAGIESLGRLPQHEVAKLYERGSILAYPSDFYEIDCISVKKAQAAGCIPVTTDFAAFDESVQHGVKVHSDRTIKDWSLPYQIGFGVKNEKAQKEWVDEVVRLLTRKEKNMQEVVNMMQWGKQFAWSNISSKWVEVLCA